MYNLLIYVLASTFVIESRHFSIRISRKKSQESELKLVTVFTRHPVYTLQSLRDPIYIR